MEKKTIALIVMGVLILASLSAVVFLSDNSTDSLSGSLVVDFPADDVVEDVDLNEELEEESPEINI